MNSKVKGWPLGIFVFYSLFVITLLIAVFITVNNDMEMVTDNYYEKTLKYESQISRIKNAEALKEKPRIAFDSKKTLLILTIPEIGGQKNLSGSIHLFRPSNFKLDRTYKLQLDNKGRQYIPMAELESGKWEIQILWQDNHKEYYFEEVIIF